MGLIFFVTVALAAELAGGEAFGGFNGGDTLAQNALEVGEVRGVGCGVRLHLAQYIAQAVEEGAATGLKAHTCLHGGTVFDSQE
jgi:hypothetical protein